MTTKSTKRALLVSVMSLFICFTMLLGTSYAWFSDTVTSTGNIIKTGTLEVSLDWAEGSKEIPTAEDGWTDASTGAIFSYENWEPGYVAARHMKITNDGSLAFKYTLSIVPQGEVGILADVIDVYVTDDGAVISDRDDLGEHVGTLRQVITNGIASGVLEKNGDSSVFTIVLKLQESAGNDYQGLSIAGGFAVQLLATQYTSEGDSIDDQYDLHAYIAGSNAIILPEGVSAETFGENVALDADGNYYATLTEAVTSGAEVLYLKPEAEVSFKNAHTAFNNDLTIYGNGASMVNGKDRDLDVSNLTEDTTLNVFNLDGVAVWGYKKNANTVNVRLVDCEDAGTVYVTGTAGVLNVTLENCTFNIATMTHQDTAVYSNANGEIVIDSCVFIAVPCALNLNHKVAGEQNITVTNTQFINCGTYYSVEASNEVHGVGISEADYYAPIRVITTAEGAVSSLTTKDNSYIYGKTRSASGAYALINGYDVLLNADYTSGSDKVLKSATGIAYSNIQDTKSVYYGAGAGDPVASVEELEAVLEEGGHVVLTDNITVEDGATLEIAADASVVMCLNGNTISGTVGRDADDNTVKVHVMANYGDLTIIGGTVTSAGTNGGSAIINYGTLNIEDATINGAPQSGDAWPSYSINNSGEMVVNNTKITSVHGAVASYGEGAVVTLNNCEIAMSGIPGFTNHGIYTYSSGKVVVNGGIYANNAADQNSTGGSMINGAVEINDGTFTGRIESYNGTPVIKGGTFSANPSKFVAEGYIATQNEDGSWTVAFDGTVVEGAEDIDSALENAEDILLSDDLTISSNDTTANSGYGTAGVKVDNNTVFDGNGNTLTVTDANGTWDSAITAKAGTIKNVTVNGAFRGIFMGSASGDVYIDNVILDKVCYTFNSDAGNKEYGVYISNSTLNGWTSYSDVHKEVVFTNCTFGKGTGGYQYAFCRPYNASVFEDCKFEVGFEFDTSKTSDLVFIDCYYGDTLITAANAATLGNGDTTFFYNGLNGITINGQTAAADASDVADALANGGNAILTEDVSVTDNVVMNGGELDGNGKTIEDTVDDADDSDCAITTTGGTVKNVTIIGNGSTRAIGSGSSGDYSLEEDLYIDNVTINKVLYAINGGGSSDANVYVKNSTIYGWCSYSGINSFNFDNCTLGMGDSSDGYMVIYGTTNFTDCKFEGVFDMGARKENDVVCAAGKTITFTNCTYDGVKVTAENFMELFYYGEGDEKDWNNLMKECIIVIDGAEVDTSAFVVEVPQE